MNAPSTAKRWPALLLRAVLLPLTGVVLAALLFEAGLRITGLQPDFFFQPDPELSATFIPGKRGWYAMDDWRQWIEINSAGYRDREWTPAKPAGALRVAMLGDSYLAGFEVAAEQRVSEQLQQRLEAACDRPVEVLNFGVSGYGTAQELETLRRRALQFQPDLVLLVFYTGNDLLDNNVELDPEPNRLHYGLAPSGDLVRQPFTVRDNAVKRWLRGHSRAYGFVRDRLRALQATRWAMTAIGAMQETTDAAPVNALTALQGAQFLAEPSPPFERSWAITAGLLGQMRDAAAAQGAAFAVAIVPIREMIDGGAAARLPGAERWDFALPLRRMQATCATLGVRCLSLLDAFRAADVDVDGSFISGHWSARGHATAAAALFDWLHDDLCGRGAADRRNQVRARPALQVAAR